MMVCCRCRKTLTEDKHRLLLPSDRFCTECAPKNLQHSSSVSISRWSRKLTASEIQQPLVIGGCLLFLFIIICSGPPGWLFLFCFLLLGALVYAIGITVEKTEGKAKRQLQMHQNHIQSQQVEAQKFLQGAWKEGIETTFLLQKDEIAYLEENSSLSEAKTESQTTGGFLGYGEGLFGGAVLTETTTRDSLKQIDTGKLVLTNRRLIFEGSLGLRIMGLADVVSAHAVSEALVVSSSSFHLRQFFAVKNPWKWIALIQAAKKSS